MERPDCVEDDHLTYLDRLRESGEVNMMGARPYLQNEFGLDKEDSRAVHTYWMKTFGQPSR